MDTATTYMLIAVTAGGFVSHADGFETKKDCEEARSIALTGETVESYQATEDKRLKSDKETRDKFYADHPPRVPKDKEERAFVAERSGSESWAPCLEICGRHVVGDLIQDDPQVFPGGGIGPGYSPDRGEWMRFIHGQMIVGYPTDVKTAECAIKAN